MSAAVKTGPKRLLNGKEAARYLGICPVVWSTHGYPILIKGIKMPGLSKHQRYDIRDLDEWIEKQKEVSNAHA